MAGDLVQIVLVSFGSNDVDHLVERHLGVVLGVVSQVFPKDAVIRDLLVAH